MFVSLSQSRGAFTSLVDAGAPSTRHLPLKLADLSNDGAFCPKAESFSAQFSVSAVIRFAPLHECSDAFIDVLTDHHATKGGAL